MFHLYCIPKSSNHDVRIVKTETIDIKTYNCLASAHGDFGTIGHLDVKLHVLLLVPFVSNVNIAWNPCKVKPDTK